MQSDPLTQLDCYLVGGAVRDELLGRVSHDRDWVVVGSTAQQMLDLGFTQVGRDFPVFLHPVSHEEYALARTEKKHGEGHAGFVVSAAPEITLEQDLARRDLTINALAKGTNGQIIDPFGGMRDLAAKRLQHVSAAFSEDPLRVFRVARFMSQLVEFHVDDTTFELMHTMAASGELSSLSAERVWQEFEKSLDAAAPDRFLTTLEQAGALRDWFAEYEEHDGPITLRSEVVGDPFQAELIYASLPFATNDAFTKRLKVPKRYLTGAQDVVGHADVVARWDHVASATLLASLEALRAFHDSTRLEFVQRYIGEREGRLESLAAEISAVRLQPSKGKELAGLEYGNALRSARLEKIEHLRLRASRDVE